MSIQPMSIQPMRMHDKPADPKVHGGSRWVGKRVGVWLGGLSLLAAGTSPVSASLPMERMLAQGSPSAGDASESDVIIHAPIIVPFPFPYPVQTESKVRVLFVAEGTEWGAVYLDDRLLFRPHNFNRREEFWLEPGAYHLEITGITRFEVWDSGYLDVGTGDSGALIVIFSKEEGVRVSGNPQAWIPDVP